ncbi:hypothetical protein ACFSOZ_17765 [Mesorhizobium newzealandense]|uniref:Uncharacterized protein n=2 Tax=Mesorhizobium TaxID=68287 RepID=A0ABW4UC43_9HYPH|nr:hypothetical protein [Mesorhizobium sophorae]
MDGSQTTPNPTTSCDTLSIGPRLRVLPGDEIDDAEVAIIHEFDPRLSLGSKS